MKTPILYVTAFLSLTQTVDAATIQADPFDVTTSLGYTFSVDIVGTGFQQTQGGGFDLTYDADILNVTHVSIDETSTWTFVNDPGSIDNVNGILSDVIVSDFPGISGDFLIASVEFLAVGLGTSRLDITESALNPWAGNGTLIHPTIIGGSSARVVPIPAAAWLFGAAIMGLVGGSVRRAM